MNNPTRSIQSYRLTWDEEVNARRMVHRFSIQRATDNELAAMADEHGTERALLLGDLAAGDFSAHDDLTLRNGIAFIEHHLAEIEQEAERRLRSRRFRQRTGTDPYDDLQARFDAMRHVDIVDAIQTLGVPLQKRGRTWTALCPFHQKQTPSFSVNRETSRWRCYGCQWSGDLVTFVMERHQMSIVEALRFPEAFIDVPGVTS